MQYIAIILSISMNRIFWKFLRDSKDQSNSWCMWLIVGLSLQAFYVDKPFACHFCSYASYRRDHLNAHLRIHTGEKPFKCPHCPYAAAISNDLKKHIRTHTGEKPYTCPHCPYAASRSSSLRRHLHDIHTVSLWTWEKTVMTSWC